MALTQEGAIIQTTEGYNDDPQVFTGTADIVGTNVSMTPLSHGSRFKIRVFVPVHANSQIQGSNQNPYWGMRIYRRVNGGSWQLADMLGTDTSGNRLTHAEVSPYRNADAVNEFRQGVRYRSKNCTGTIIDKPDYTVGDTIEWKMQIHDGNNAVYVGPAHHNSTEYFSQPYGMTIDEISGGFIPNPDLTHDGSTAERAAPSAKFIKDLTGTTTNGLYWIDVQGTPIQLYCDMSDINGGGWTLIGKSGGGSWNDPNGWLKSNINESSLQNTNNLSANGYACIDARVIASVMATECALSNSARDKWVRAPFHSQCSPETIFNHKIGQAEIESQANNEEGSEQVTATAWNAETTTSWVNKYSVMTLAGHGGSTPAWTLNTVGNTSVNEYAMAVACATSDHNGFTVSGNHNGMDAPYDATWPNSSYNSGMFLGCVWVR